MTFNRIESLLDACARGDLETVQRFAQLAGLAAADVRTHALHVVCMHGHLACAQWLVERFGLTAADARAEDNYALLDACSGGHIVFT